MTASYLCAHLSTRIRFLSHGTICIAPSQKLLCWIINVITIWTRDLKTKVRKIFPSSTDFQRKFKNWFYFLTSQNWWWNSANRNEFMHSIWLHVSRDFKQISYSDRGGIRRRRWIRRRNWKALSGPWVKLSKTLQRNSFKLYEFL